jgi:hypothetical protein
MTGSVTSSTACFTAENAEIAKGLCDLRDLCGELRHLVVVS